MTTAISTHGEFFDRKIGDREIEREFQQASTTASYFDELNAKAISEIVDATMTRGLVPEDQAAARWV